MNGTARKVTDLPTIDYAAAMTAPFVAVSSIAGVLGVRPHYMQVHLNLYDEMVHDRPWCVTVQAENVADVDRMADHWSFAEDGGDGGNYTRSGEVHLTGIGDVLVRVYCGRPDDDGAEVAR